MTTDGQVEGQGTPHRFWDGCQNWYWKSPDRVARRISPLQYRLVGVEGMQVRVLPIRNMDTSFQKTTASDEWGTPRELVRSLGIFDLDPCASKENHQAPLYYTKEDGSTLVWPRMV